MSAINNNVLTPGFAPPSALPAFSSLGGPSLSPATFAPGRTDNIESAPYQPAQQDAGEADFEEGYGQDTGTGTLSSAYNQLLNSLSSLFSNFGSMFGYASNPGTAVPAQPSPQSRGQAQVFFSSATANSVGDPHETFDGTTGAGGTIDEKWDSMKSHPNLLDSNSFSGGYRVSTSVTKPSSTGITQNQSATVTTGGGATSVTMNQDGSCSVVSNGRNLTLPVGQAQNLGNGETVTLNADKSLTVVDENGRGGCITTTLKPNGTGGVDVSNNAKNVDLGGSLVGHSEYLAGSNGTGDNPKTTPYGSSVPPPPVSFGFVDPFVQPQFVQPQLVSNANQNENENEFAYT